MKSLHDVFMQEIQEALDERQNDLDSLLTHNNQVNIPLAQPFAFESQIDTDTYPVNLSLKSIDEETQPTNGTETNVSNETIPLLAAPNEEENEIHRSELHRNYQRKSSWTSAKDLSNIKKEPATPVKTKRRHSKTLSSSKQKTSSSSSIAPMRQMTLTQLFDPIDSPTSIRNSTSIKQEPNTPSEDISVFMPESLIGLAQPSESMSDTDYEQNISSVPLSPFIKAERTAKQSLKRKSSLSPTVNTNHSKETQITDEEENIQNQAILQSPNSQNESDELLYACRMCRNYWLGLPDELRHKQGLTCRHRQRPVARTPEHFWSLGMPSTQTCIQRGYGGVLPPDKPIERPRRPRRQYQRKLQEQQLERQNEQMNDNDDDDDDEE